MRRENEELRREIISLKTNLINKYEEIRQNNEQLFKNFEEKNQDTITKLKTKQEAKVKAL